MSVKLRSLLVHTFTADELDRFFSDYYPNLRTEVAFDGPTAKVAASVIDVLSRHKRLDDQFFGHLRAVRPKRLDDIEAARREWENEARRQTVASSPPSAPDASVSRIEQTTTNHFHGAVIMGDGGTVGNTYTNTGPVGAMGHNATANTTTLAQEASAAVASQAHGTASPADSWLLRLATALPVVFFAKAGFLGFWADIPPLLEALVFAGVAGAVWLVVLWRFPSLPRLWREYLLVFVLLEVVVLGLAVWKITQPQPDATPPKALIDPRTEDEDAVQAPPTSAPEKRSPPAAQNGQQPKGTVPNDRPSPKAGNRTVDIDARGPSTTGVGGNVKAKVDEATIKATDGATGVRESVHLKGTQRTRIEATEGGTGVGGDLVIDGK